MSIAMQVPTPDGRELEVLVAGPEDGFPLVSHHGTPQARCPTRCSTIRLPNGG